MKLITALLTLGLFSSLSSQSINEKQYIKIRSGMLKINAVSFTVDDTSHILFNDGRSDTVIKRQRFFAYREKNLLHALKIDSVDQKAVYTFSSGDTCIYYRNLKRVNKYDAVMDPNAFYSHFNLLRYVIGKPGDKVLLNPNDSLIKNSDYSYTLINKQNDSFFGSLYSEQTFVFNEQKIMRRYIHVFQSDSYIKNSYSSGTYHEIRYYKSAPGQMLSLFAKLRDSAEYHYRKNIRKSVEFKSALKLGKTDSLLPFKSMSKLSNKRGNNFDSIIRSGRYTLLYFWFEGCVPCKRVKPLLLKLQEEYADSGLNLAGINNTDGKDFVFANETGFISFFDTGSFTSVLKINGAPVIILVDNKGYIHGRLDGYLPEEFSRLNDYIDGLFN